MLSIRGVYEVAIRVKDLARSEPFYRDVLGLKPALRDDQRHWLFLWVGGKAGVVVLQQDPSRFAPQHFAFSVEEGELDRAAEMLARRGIAVEGPVLHEWMQAKSLYFADPDGHDLELCAPIRHERPA
jgi:lactoylglutathione lyase